MNSANKFNNLDEIFNTPWETWAIKITEETDILSSSVSIKETEFVIKKPPPRKTQYPDDFTC